MQPETAEAGPTLGAERLTNTDVAILDALATYQFLTPKQLRLIGVTRSRTRLYDRLRTLDRRGFVGSLEFGVLPGAGRLAAVYFLTPHGADILALARRTDPVAVPLRPPQFRNDYLHRVGCVDFHISLRQWADRNDATVDFFDTYFDRGTVERGRPRERTRVALRRGSIVPDAVFALTPADGIERLFVLEFHNLTDTAGVERKLVTYLHALDQEAIELAYDYPHAVVVLSVFGGEATLARVERRLSRRAAFQPFVSYFLFKTLPEVQADFVHGWRQIIAGNSVSLFET